MAFIVLLGATALTGLTLYAATRQRAGAAAAGAASGDRSGALPASSWSKMVHGFFRFTALVAEAARARRG